MRSRTMRKPRQLLEFERMHASHACADLSLRLHAYTSGFAGPNRRRGERDAGGFSSAETRVTLAE